MSDLAPPHPPLPDSDTPVVTVAPMHTPTPPDAELRGCRSRRCSSLLPTCHLLRLHHPLLSLVWQLLGWQEKVLQVSHLSRQLSPLTARDFASETSVHICAFPSFVSVSCDVQRCVQRLFSHLRSLSVSQLGLYNEPHSKEQFIAALSLLFIPTPSVSPAGTRLEAVTCDPHTSSQSHSTPLQAFPSLTSLEMRADLWWHALIDAAVFSPLASL
jgi:hypothetical protein